MNASCVLDTKFGKDLKIFKCQCDEGFTGNGVQCFDSNGVLSEKPEGVSYFQKKGKLLNNIIRVLLI